MTKLSKRMYGIKTPGDDNIPPYYSWVTEDSFSTWRLFFGEHQSRAPTATAISAYESIGYKCIELDVTEA